MVCKANCATITGVVVLPVTVETDICNGLPSFDMVGLISSDIKESRERVRTALKNSGFLVPPKRITINFSPGNLRKSGTYFDLAIAISILQSLGVISEDISKMIFIGELSLNGDTIRVNGVLPIVLDAVSRGLDICFVPKGNIKECEGVGGIKIVPVDSLNHLVQMITTGNYEEPNFENRIIQKEDSVYDFKYIKGQAQARRGAEIAVAGMHNFLMVGAPGTGKSIIARSMQTIMPEMSKEEQIEISKIQSVAGLLEDGPVTQRPFRSPHHTATVAAMIGGGANPKPGEITLAHGGILYMDEFPEFSRAVMESLRQPMEDGVMNVTRTYGSFEFPANFMLLAAMNPCRCGYYPDRNKCNCTEHDVKKYLEKVSGPIMDRIDLCTRMNSVSYKELSSDEKLEDSATIRARVNKAVEIQKERYKDEDFQFNSDLKGRLIKKYCKLGKKEEAMLKNVYDTFSLSVRTYEKILKTARTIADLEGEENIKERHLAEALSFRVIDGKDS